MGSSRAKDTSGHLWVEEGEDAVGPVATVALIGPFDRSYTYTIPEKYAERLGPGQRVTVPVGKRGRPVEGFCVSVDHAPWKSTLRPVDAILDEESFLTPELLELGRWMASYYACPLGRTLQALVPGAVHGRRGYRKVVHVSPLQSLESIVATHPRIGVKQRAVLERLARADAPLEWSALLADSDASPATVRTLAARGWVRLVTQRRPGPPPDFDRPASEPEFRLNAEQRAAVERIGRITDAAAFRVVLLYGVAGSGKTEVYVRAMRRVLETGRQVILLVPEIALTTQLVDRLASRFRQVAVIHSGLTDAHRSLTWAAIRSGRKKVVIGTRSAAFAPCPDLGLIVVDEEQESSYKNLRAPRFHVRDVAIKRAQQRSIPVVLGSATPSMESWQNCLTRPHYERIDLPSRVRGLPMPSVAVVDMNDEYHVKTGVPVLSRVLMDRLGNVLSRGEQAVLLMNRRGYAVGLVCPQCRQRLQCPDCNVNMVYHAPRNELLCHYCRRRSPAPEHCPNPSCGGRMVRSGSGTQRVEEMLNRRFPDARIVRVDSDTMRAERDYRQVIAEFESGKTDCLVGTQMIAKGLDFPRVSFVGIVGAETSASLPDFRAEERLFQLVTQVAGRAGRGSVSGQVVVQTLSPESPALRCAVRHDFNGFVGEELDVRRRTRMPPFSRLTRIVVIDADEQRSRQVAEMLADRARGSIDALSLASADVLGPMPCVLARLRSRYRHELLLRCVAADAMGRLLGHLGGDGLLGPQSGATVQVDVDPVTLT